MNDSDRDPRLAAALRAMPDCAPPADGWARLSATLDARHATRRRGPPGLLWALAAALVVALGIGLSWPPPAGDDAASPVVQDIAGLIADSNRLERELALARRDVTVWNVADAERTELLRRDLQLIDLQLAAVAEHGDSEAARALWQSRVQLMEWLVRAHRRAGDGPLGQRPDDSMHSDMETLI